MAEISIRPIGSEMQYETQPRTPALCLSFSLDTMRDNHGINESFNLYYAS